MYSTPIVKAGGHGIVKEIEYNRVDGVEPEEYIDVALDLYNRSARLQNWLVQTEDNQLHEWRNVLEDISLHKPYNPINPRFRQMQHSAFFS